MRIFLNIMLVEFFLFFGAAWIVVYEGITPWFVLDLELSTLEISE